jgi:hypothetical protein
MSQRDWAQTQIGRYGEGELMHLSFVILPVYYPHLKGADRLQAKRPGACVHRVFALVQFFLAYGGIRNRVGSGLAGNP